LMPVFILSRELDGVLFLKMVLYAFFLSHLFFFNLFFLIRQYVSFAFFILFLYGFARFRFLSFFFFLISLLSHLSAIIFLVFSYKYCARFLKSWLAFFAVTAILVVRFDVAGVLIFYFIEAIDVAGKFFPVSSDILRKVQYFRFYDYKLGEVSIPVVALCYISVALFVAFGREREEN